MILKFILMTTTSVKKITSFAIFLYANSKFRFFFKWVVKFYCTDFGSLASDSFPQSSRSLRSALEAEVRRLDSLSVCALRKSMFRKPLSNERGALVYYISCTQGPCASNTRKNRICNILLPRRRSISCFNFFFQIISLPYVVAYDRCRLKKLWCGSWCIAKTNSTSIFYFIAK